VGTGISDGNRDIPRRIITVPCNPQFKRYIPSYLDHGAPGKGEEDEPTPEKVYKLAAQLLTMAAEGAPSSALAADPQAQQMKSIWEI
jgi:hypothetical protein